jgi:hypothetical protein
VHRIVGTVAVGSTIRCTVAWLGRPADTAYTWQIGGAFRASGQRLALTSADRGKTVRCTAEARNAYGASRVSSARRQVR